MILKKGLSYIVTDGDECLLGVYENEEDAKKRALDSMQVKKINILHTSISFCFEDDMNELFELRFADETVWVWTFNYPEALVEATLNRRGRGLIDALPEMIRSYDTGFYDYPFEKADPEIYDALTPPVLEALSFLTEKNKDLCAHLINHLERIDTVDELRALELRINANVKHPKSGKPFTFEGTDGLPLGTLKGIASRVYCNYLLMEEYGFTGIRRKFMDSPASTDDTDEFFFYLFAFEHWSNQMPVFPYKLYECLKCGVLEPYYSQYSELRGV